MTNFVNRHFSSRLIGSAAMVVCVLGYGGMGLALLLGKLGHIDMVHAGILAAASGIVGEIGLWVGAAYLGLKLFSKRTAKLNRLLGRDRTATKLEPTKFGPHQV